MDAILQQFDDDLRLRNLAVQTRKQYRCFLAVFLRSYPDVEALCARDFRRFLLGLVDQGRKPSTVRVYGAALKRWARFTLCRPELIVGLSLPRSQYTRARPPVAPADMDALFRAAHGRPLDYTLLAVLYGTGLRISEATHLTTDDIDGEQGILHIRHGKGDKARAVPLTRRLLAVLRRYWRVVRPPGPWMFPAVRLGTRGQQPAPHCFADHPMHLDTARKRIVRLGERAGLSRRVLPHDLRRTYATVLTDADVDMAIVQQLLGHRCIETTARYAQVRVETLAGLRHTLERLHAVTR